MTRFHVHNKAKKWRIVNTVAYEKVAQIIAEINYTPYKLMPSWMFDMGSNTLNACAFLPGIIIINSEWIAHLALFQNVETRNAFIATLGHEMAHKDNDYVFWEFGTKDKKFVNWINEVHADFSGADKSFQADRVKEINAIEYKLRFKSNKDKDSSGHPSWKKRLEYVTNYNFNKRLIRRIADDVKCGNEILIQNVMEHFSDIVLM